MGVLYRGFDPVLDREVAIKLMLADFSEDTEQMRPRLLPRGARGRQAAAPQHRHDLRVRRRVQRPVHRDGVPARHAARCPDALAAAAHARRQAECHRPVVRRLELRARAGRRPSRRQAGQRLPPRGRHGEAARLRHREADDVDADAPGRCARQRVVHVARAGGRQRLGRWPRRHVLDRRGALRDARAAQAVRGRRADRGHPQDPEGRSDARSRPTSRACLRS